MKLNDKTVKGVLAGLLATAVVLYIAYQVFSSTGNDYRTELAVNASVKQTADGEAYVLREEVLVTSSLSGTVVSLAADSEHVTGGDAVAVVFASETDAENYLRMEEIKEEISRYETLSRQANLQAMDIASLNSDVKNDCTRLLELTDRGELSGVKDYINDFRDSVTSLQISTGAVLSFDDKLTALRAEEASLSSSYSTSNRITAPVSGYYVNSADGYEGVIPYNSVDELTEESINSALASSPVATSADVKGRLITAFRWYILTVVDTKYVGDIEIGQKIYVDFPDAGITDLPVKVYSVGDKNAEKTKLIFECSLMNPSLASLRIEKINVVFENYTGCKLSNSAIRVVDGVQGVYTVTGGIVSFKKICPVYSNDSYTISAAPAGESGYLRLYDSIITEGVDLYDGKLIN